MPFRHYLFDGDLEREAFVRFLLLGDFGVDLRRHDAGQAGAADEAPSNFMPNHSPNSSALVSARQTRARGACRRMVFSIRSVIAIAHYATSRLHE